MRRNRKTIILTLILSFIISLGTFAQYSEAKEQRPNKLPPYWQRDGQQKLRDNPRVTASKQNYLTGERVTFNFEFAPGPGAVLILNYFDNPSNPKAYARHSIIGRTFARSFDQPGKYEAYIITRDNQKYIREKAAVFYVAEAYRGRPDTRPTAASVYLDKTVYRAGERVKFNFAYPGDNVRALLVIQYNSDAGNRWQRYDTIDVTNRNSYTTNFNRPGNYAVHLRLTKRGDAESVDSKRVTFKVRR
jgi:hypothetical protein